MSHEYTDLVMLMRDANGKFVNNTKAVTEAVRTWPTSALVKLVSFGMTLSTDPITQIACAEIDRRIPIP